MEQEPKMNVPNKAGKWLKKENFLVLILLGVLVLVIAWPMEKKEYTEQEGAQSSTYFSERQSAGGLEYVAGLEQSLEALLCSMEGVGENKVMITVKTTQDNAYLTTGRMMEIEGVVVCAKGAGNGKVAKNISEVIQALFGIEAHKIKIVKMI